MLSVTHQLDAASFLKIIDDVPLHPAAYPIADPTSLDKELASINSRIEGARLETLIQIIETLADDFPTLATIHQKHQADIRKRLEVFMASLANAEHLDLPADFELRPKQQRFLTKLREYFSHPEEFRRTGFVKYPTGMGKTILIALMVKAVLQNKGSKVLVLSPREAVNDQNIDKIGKLQDPTTTVKDVQEIANGDSADVTIATYNLMALEGDRPIEDLKLKDNYDVIFLDECHRSFGPKLVKALRSKYPDAILIGLSATPYMGATADPTKLKSAFHFFEGEIDSITLRDACEDGDLAAIRAMRVKVKGEVIDDNDDTDAKLGKKLSLAARTRIAVDIAKNKIPTNEKGIIFCKGVKHAKDTVKSLKEAGIKAAWVDGKTSKTDRQRIFEQLKTGEIQFIANADLLVEGFDEETIKHAIMLRPTMSIWLYEQMIGRICRLDPNDPEKIATVWDVVGQHSGQCTIQGLSEFYGKHKEAYLNGEIVFGPKEVSDIVRTTLRSGGLKGDVGLDGEMEDVIPVEDIGKVNILLEREYFENPDTVRNDLWAFARAAKLDSIEKLRISDKYSGITAQLTNGILVKFTTYIRSAGRALMLAETAKEAHSKGASILNTLKLTAGCEIKVSSEMDKSYFGNNQNIQHDLEAFAKACGAATIEDLTTTYLGKTVLCQNGEKVSLAAYLRRAGVRLKAYATYDEAIGQERDILNRLKKQLGLNETKEFNHAYFSDLENIRFDLGAFATASGKDDYRALNTRDLGKKAKCKSVQTPTFITYLINAGISLGLVSKENAKNKAGTTLQYLKNLLDTQMQS